MTSGIIDICGMIERLRELDRVINGAALSLTDDGPNAIEHEGLWTLAKVEAWLYGRGFRRFRVELAPEMNLNVLADPERNL